MNITLLRATINDADLIQKMQKEAFAELLEKYQDYETNPGNESLDKIKARLEQKFTYFYFIKMQDEYVGAIRVVDKKDENTRKKISPLFILPQYCNMGIAQKAIELAEEIHGKENLELGTILQEKKNCHLYEKMGYKTTGNTKIINDKLTLVFYEK